MVRYEMLSLMRDERGHSVRVGEAARGVKRARLGHHYTTTRTPG